MVDATGILATMGEDSAGIHAQSIGGSGGASGTISGSVSGENQKGSQGGGVSVSVGLEGGEGGIAGDVSVTSSAVVGTVGDRSRGIFAQSIGGSGGSGGEASNNFENASNEMSISVGGPGGSGSQAGNVDVAQTMRQSTPWAMMPTASLRSRSAAVAAPVERRARRDLRYESANSNTFAIAVGGSGGNGSLAGDVAVANGGIITTSGDYSFGIRAQSIGGGGGVGGAIIRRSCLATGTRIRSTSMSAAPAATGSSAGDVTSQ